MVENSNPSVRLAPKTRCGRFREWAGNLYLLYAIHRFGWREGLCRFWTYSLSPVNLWNWTRDKYAAWRLVDRRRKLNGCCRNVYLVNRDGDLGAVECPECHRLQGLGFDKISYLFECSYCGILFKVYLEDGLIKVRDHREGNIPLPGRCVEDDKGDYHLGIDKDAPWWWRRSRIYRDYNPKNGLDGHGHKPYDIIMPRPTQPGPTSEAETGMLDADKRESASKVV